MSFGLRGGAGARPSPMTPAQGGRGRPARRDRLEPACRPMTPPRPLPAGGAPDHRGDGAGPRAPGAAASRRSACRPGPRATRPQPLLQPGQRLVSREGDPWRWAGYAVAAGPKPSRPRAAAGTGEPPGRTARRGRSSPPSTAAEGARTRNGGVWPSGWPQLTRGRQGRPRRPSRRGRAARRRRSRAQSRAEAQCSVLEGRLETASGRRQAPRRRGPRAAETELAARRGCEGRNWEDLDGQPRPAGRHPHPRSRAARMTMLRPPSRP